MNSRYAVIMGAVFQRAILAISIEIATRKTCPERARDVNVRAGDSADGSREQLRRPFIKEPREVQCFVVAECNRLFGPSK
jgi:hypothetical protein